MLKRTLKICAIVARKSSRLQLDMMVSHSTQGSIVTDYGVIIVQNGDDSGEKKGREHKLTQHIRSIMRPTL